MSGFAGSISEFIHKFIEQYHYLKVNANECSITFAVLYRYLQPALFAKNTLKVPHNYQSLMISIITPVLNEKQQLPGFLKQLSSLQGSFECLMVDGGSTDGSVEIIREHPEVKLLRSEKGRGRQMNVGAQNAKGEVLLFLHVDTFLPTNAINLIEESMLENNVVGGCFQLKFDVAHPLLAFISWFSRFNHSLFTYGDQALFVKRDEFMKAGMFRELQFMEDVEVQFRLRKRGKFIQLPEKVITSARRFLKNGIIRQFLTDAFLVSLYRMGVSADRLKRYYPEP